MHIFKNFLSFSSPLTLTFYDVSPDFLTFLFSEQVTLTCPSFYN